MGPSLHVFAGGAPTQRLLKRAPACVKNTACVRPPPAASSATVDVGGGSRHPAAANANGFIVRQRARGVQFRRKIIGMVAVQITMIIASFVTIVHFESQTAMAGNVVNVAGKNRALTITVQVEIHKALLDGGGGDYGGVADALSDLEENVLFLKEGGTRGGIAISPLAEKFEGDWDAVWGKFAEYRGKAAALEAPPGAPAGRAIGGLDEASAELVTLSDALTDKLGRDVDELSMNLVRLQTALGLGNVVLHLLMIALILRAFARHADQMVRAGRLAAVGELASTVAHDMKNPLGTIANAAASIRSNVEGGRGSGSTVAAALGLIDRSVMRMSHQIDGVLSHARTTPLATGIESVRGMLDGALHSLQVPGNVSITLPDDDARITCDGAKMEFVFFNIMLNAIQAMGEGGGRIAVGLERGGGGGVALSFENSGPPIGKADIGRVFEPLFTTKMQGTGLGLTSCRNIVRQHGGGMSVRNDPVTFTVRLPGGGDD